MPYIRQEDRPELEGKAERLGKTCKSTGELNFALTTAILAFLDEQERVGYAQMSAIRGVLADVSSEFYRRVVVPYERRKCYTNGDVYPEPEPECCENPPVAGCQP